MGDKVTNKNAETEEIIKNFKPNLELQSSEISEGQLKILKSCIERNEKIVNNKDETDIEYINDKLNNVKSVFKGFCSMYNIDSTRETVDDSTFIETPGQINPQNNDNKCFQYFITTYLSDKEIKCHPERISKIKPFINSLNWKSINPPQEQVYQQFEMNKSIALNILQFNNE